jgi:transcriptional regulator with XRE-family HTH domain
VEKDLNVIVDLHVGQRLKNCRRQAKITQKEIAEKLNVTFQQIQKYENGKNKIGAGRLFEISNLLGVPITYFYQELPKECQKKWGLKEEEVLSDFTIDNATRELITNFNKIKDDAIKQEIIEIVKKKAE